MADVPTDGFGGIFQTYSRADSSWLAVYQNHFDRITSTVSQGSDPRSPTGWAQVNGRNAISWDEKFARDVWYVDHRSLALDLKILFLTALQVVRRTGINASADTTMPEFKGPSEGVPT